MTRKNYDRFISVAQNELREDYFLQTWDTDKNYPMPFAKVRLNGTRYIENVFEKAQMHQGIYVDILPYDNYPIKRSKQKSLYRKRLFIQSMIMMKCHYMKFKSNAAWKYVLKSIMFTFIRLFSLFRSKKSLVKQYNKMTHKFALLSSNALYEQTVNSKFGYWVIPKDCFDDYVELEFEEINFKCPKYYEKYLQTVYGDYMTPPPPEKRAVGHNILEVDFGEHSAKVEERI